MFLRPQHFQAAQRAWYDLTERHEKWDLHYNWGLHALDLDLDALTNYRCVVRSAEARLRDGTLIAVAADSPLPACDLRGAFATTSAVTVYLGVPVLQLGRANVAAAHGERGRYLVETRELEDENTGVNPQPVPVRQLNVQVLLSTQDHAGFEVVPIARLERSARAEAVPQLDPKYIPPVLACDAWPGLTVAVLAAVHERLGKKIELLATQIVSRGITLDSHAQGDPLIFAQLRELNEAYAVLGVLAFAQGIHPLQAYFELCRLVGQLAVFGATRRPPELARYDHDNLAGCFFRVKQQLDTLLDIFVEPEYKERAFLGAGLRMQVTLEPAWLESAWQLFIGVQSSLEPGECVRLLTKTGQLDMKIGSSDRVDTIFRAGEQGLRFAHSPRPPSNLPAPPGMVYFQLNRDTSAEWQHVQKSLNLALRLNENLIVGNIQGQRMLTIKTAGQTNSLQFTLYVVPQASTPA
jgi:type VI secretion system protein ImpJ